MKAFVLIVTNPGKTRNVIAALKKIDGVTGVDEVMGPYDVVALLEATRLTDIQLILSGSIRSIEGVRSTTTLAAFPA